MLAAGVEFLENTSAVSNGIMPAGKCGIDKKVSTGQWI